jgi:hypothetical protein
VEEAVKATIYNTACVRTFESVLQAGPTGNGQYFGVVQEVREETTPSGLVARVSGGKRHTFIPTRLITRAEVEE